MLKSVLAILVLLGSPAAAQEKVAEYRSGGVNFKVPVPPGYCLPKESQFDALRAAAAGDNRNVTHLALLACNIAADGSIPEYILFKTPNEVVNATLELGQFLAEAGAAFESPALAELLASGKLTEESEASISKALGSKVDLSGGVRPLGKDERCAYMGGTMQVQRAAIAYKFSVGTCMTVVAGRLMTINWYGPDKGAAGVAALLAASKRLAVSIRGAPAP